MRRRQEQQGSGPENYINVSYSAAYAGEVEQSFNNKNYWSAPAIMCLTGIFAVETSADPLRLQECKPAGCYMSGH